ncbi:XrtA system polysaccharide chain length determinant [uncultured Marinobacter sp.]|jgi:polysaccharide chain length determinant protein (PEP-CTERM system associated)|uniref:XrtA system polysaccharide chain length determinant n=1 Tax=uncultured Marinobacter sp. TaxID=187379 RepID=UPI000E88D73C|nr:XrtA system polysaccharide chain length determinant [uncultured Marinobacter sp.]HAS76323.1 lipopolysaccharide biosynthesis protein [Marinobacter adhaerens]|tara:strand:- start:3648 stop:5174 length:1527 start_codon:yes stop_codon:yes gene_type:complete
MALPLSSLPVEILREVRSRKWQVFLLFVLISFLVLGAGFVWPYKYKSEVVIFVDDQNIIRPLMEGSAITTEISDQASSARQTLSNRETLERVARDPDIYGPGALGADESVLEARIARLRANLAVRPAGGSYFSIGYSSESPVQAFRISQKLGQLFISESSQRKRMESRSAYDFIDKQVKSYEAQLAAVEQRLKNFLSQNKEGTEQEARSRMSSLKSQLELAQLERSELQTRVQSLRDQLNRIDPTVRQGRTADAFQQRISDMESQLDELRLRYLDSYPDIVILKEQIAELRNQQRNAIEQGNSGGQSVSGEDIVNPLYQDVRSSLSETLADMETTTTRINSLNRLIAEQEKRMDRIQESKAQYSEITRDMEVNTQIYNDLLRRREKARVSMHLDIEGQGLNFEIYESAQFPTSPSDLNFSMFAFAGVFLGALAPFGAIAGLLQIDPRIRARKQLEDGIGLPVLAEIPPVRTPFEKRRDRWVTLTIFVFAGVAVAVYVGIATAALMGVI